MPHKEFKIVVVRKISEVQGNMERQFSEIRKQFMNKTRSLTER